MDLQRPTTSCSSRQESVEVSQEALAKLLVTIAIYLARHPSSTTEMDVRILFGKVRYTLAPNATSSPGQTTRKRVHGSCRAARLLHDVQVQPLNGFYCQDADSICSKQKCRYNVILLRRWMNLFVSHGRSHHHFLFIPFCCYFIARFSDASPRRFLHAAFDVAPSDALPHSFKDFADLCTRDLYLRSHASPPYHPAIILPYELK